MCKYYYFSFLIILQINNFIMFIIFTLQSANFHTIKTKQQYIYVILLENQDI